MKKKEKIIKKKPKLQLDPWQRRVLEAKGDLCVCAGRQTGKSTVVAIKAAEFMVNTPGKFVMIVSTTEDQAILLKEKILDYLEQNYKTWLKRPYSKYITKHKIELTNGSSVQTKAVGTTGTSIRGFTVDMLIVDEAALMPEDVWPAVTPMLLTTGGAIILISTPYGRRGYFYEAYHSPDWKTFHVNSVEVMKEREICETWTEPMKEYALERLEKERKRMSENQFKQEYLGQFIDDLMQFFPDECIKERMIVPKDRQHPSNAEYYIGVDVARMGDDASTFEVGYKRGETVIHCLNEITRKTILTETYERITLLDKKYDFQKIFIDDEGMGIGVFDMLISSDQTKRKTVALRNSRKTIDYKNDRKIKMLKEDLYLNLLRLMEQRKIELLDDELVFQSLKSVQYEFLEDKKGHVYMRIFSRDHKDSHIVEGLIRMAWCAKSKNIKMLVSSFRI